MLINNSKKQNKTAASSIRLQNKSIPWGCSNGEDGPTPSEQKAGRTDGGPSPTALRPQNRGSNTLPNVSAAPDEEKRE